MATDAWELTISASSVDEAEDKIIDGREELDDARAALGTLPAWSGAGDFPMVAERYADWLERALDEAQDNPSDIPRETLNAWSDRFLELLLAADSVQSGSMGCGLESVF